MPARSSPRRRNGYRPAVEARHPQRIAAVSRCPTRVDKGVRKLVEVSAVERLAASPLIDVGIPVGILATGHWRSSERGVSCRFRDRPFHGGHYRPLAGRADPLWNEEVAKGGAPYGKPPAAPGLLRTRNWALSPAGRLILDVQPTWYYTYLGTNKAVERGTWTGPAQTSDARALSQLSSSRLANPLTVNIAVVTGSGADRVVIVQRRGRAVASAGELYQVSAAGFVDREDETWPQGPAWRAAAREASEETDLQLGPEQIDFLTFCRSTRRLHLGLCGVARIPSVPDLPSGPPQHDAFEIDGLELWPWEPAAIEARLGPVGGWKAFVPLGAAAMVAALAFDFPDWSPRST